MGWRKVGHHFILLMVVDDLNVMGVAVAPAKADPPLVIASGLPRYQRDERRARKAKRALLALTAGSR
jgi:hypothetical protein